GPLVVVSDDKWQTHSGTSGQVSVASGRVILKSSDSEDVNALLDGQPYSTASGVDLFHRFTINFSSLPTSSGGYFAHFKDGGTNFRGKLFATTAGASGGRFRLGISNAGNSVDAVLPIDLEL